MTHVPHTLGEEFPEHHDRMHALKLENAHFSRLWDEYHEVNRAIHRAETDIEHTDDRHITDMRKQRMRLKDEIYAMLAA